MLRFKPIADAGRAELYYSKSDGGYYLDGGELRREWGGQGARMIGLSGEPEFEQFKRLIHGLDPWRGGQLTAKLVEDRIPAWDITASMPKGVTIALERGDGRIRELLWQANREAIADLERFATTRVRKGGQQEDRLTHNLVWYGTEHPETRPVEDVSLPLDHPWRVMPDPDRHIHNVLFNLTFDPAEQEWKAVKFRPIMDLRKFFSHRFDLRLSHLLAEAGYAIETSWREDAKGTVRYHSWDIQGIPAEVRERFSRRTAEVEEAEATIIATLKARDADAPDRLSAVTRDGLGATSRRQKREGLTLADYREYWDSRVSPAEGRAIAETIRRARLGLNPKPRPGAEQAVAFSLRHHFEQRSVVPVEELEVTAIERCLGAARPEEIAREFARQGVIVRERDGRRLATTAEVQREEEFIVGIAANGRGSVAPIGVATGLQRGRLNDGQWQAVLGLLGSSNRVNLVEGPAGAGKSSLLKAFDAGAELAGGRVAYLASTTDAAEVLKRDGFEANTVARFLVDSKLQQAAKGCRLVVDEASLLGHGDAFRLFQLAGQLDVKLILVGDPMQHGSVPRGALLRVLTEYGGLKPFRLSEILRQEGAEYRAAATLLSQGETAEGFDALDRMGWVQEIAGEERYRRIAADYLQALEEKKSVLLVSPTHAEAATITDELRAVLRAAGRLGEEEREFSRLAPTNASEAERGRVESYRPGDVLVFHQNAKGFTKGQRLVVDDPAAVPFAQAAKFQVYRPEAIGLSVGDKIRFTGSVKTRDGKHRLSNGQIRSVAGWTKGGDIRLDNGWVVAADVGMFRSGWVETSFSSQGKTVQRAIVAVAAASLPAANQEMLYVSSSRAKERMSLYSDDKQAVRQAVQRSSQKLAALELKPEPPAPPERLHRQKERRRRWAFFERVRAAWQALERQPERQVRHERGR